MDTLFNSFHPFFFIIAIGLTIMASYTALDMFRLIRTSDQNKRLLFLGGTFSMGMGIWVTKFMGLIVTNAGLFANYYIPLVILSILIGIAFSGMAFMPFFGRKIRFYHLMIGSLFLTLAVIAIHIIGNYALNVEIEYHVLLFIVSSLLIFASFLFSLWMLFSSKNSQENQTWLKPVSALIMSGTIAEGHILLRKSLVIITANDVTNATVVDSPFFNYLVLFVSVLIMGGLIVSSTLISKQLAASDTTLRDITKEVKDITFALNQSSIVAITDEKGRITSVNNKFCEISKYSEEELLGQDHRILNSGYHSKEFFKELWRTIGHGKVWYGEICNRAKDGTLYWVDTTIVPFLNKNGKPYQYLSIRTDITERKKQEEVLHRQDKLAAVGQLAAGVAHEIRNPLTSMRGYAEFLQLDEKDPERLEFLNIILDEIERVNTIVEDFLVLAKPKAVELEEKNIVPVIKTVISMQEFEAIKKNVRLHFDCEQKNILINCDENRLKQVFLNFIKNAIEAMPNGGDLYVKAMIHDNNVQISIQDTGVGIPKEQLKKLGEPFFTTKKQGHGLGLMMSFKIIEGHQGKVFVESELNKGTTFNILLPAKKTA